MPHDTGWDRRRFLSAALRTCAGAGLAAAGPLFADVEPDATPRAASPSTTRAPTSSPSTRITGDASADAVLNAALNALLPATGPGPSAAVARVADHLAVVAALPEFQGLRDHWQRSAPLLDAFVREQAGAEFAALPATRAAALLTECATSAPAALQTLLRSLREVAMEGYFGHPRHGGNPDGVVWKAYGLEQMMRTLDSTTHAATHGAVPAAATIQAAANTDRLLRQTWDVVVVGSGAGGAALAWRLSTRGLRVLVLEKGARIDQHVATHDEIAATRRNLFVPYTKDEPHVIVAQPGAAPERRRDGWSACCVGGGTVHMSAMLMRMHPSDFDGRGGQATWPFDYAVLRPYYDLVEQFIGTSGDRNSNPFEAPGVVLPLPPIRTHPVALSINDVARAARWHPYPTPRGILSQPYRGRGECVYCPFCASYACEVGAKASADVSFLRLAEATGQASVVPGVRVTAIRVSGKRAAAVDVVDDSGQQRSVTGAIVVLAAGAVESPRLAFLSATPSIPKGVGNQHDQVGRNLTGSYNAGLAGRFEFPGDRFAVANDHHPFLNVALQDFYNADCGTIVLDRRPVSPIQHAILAATQDRRPLVGAALKERVSRELAQSRSVVVESFIPMRPHPDRRVTLDEQVTDTWHQPAARLTFARNSEDAAHGRRVVQVGDQLLRAAGAAECGFAIELEETPFLLSGGMRMGRDPAKSVTDAHGRVHGLENVFVCDGSALPGMGGVPPTLTIMANAVRIADAIASRRG